MSSSCPNKDRCGSCPWSHIPYEKQLKQKVSDINGSFKLKKLSERVKEILPSPKTAHYRNRMDFVIDFQGQVGMREKGKWWRVIDNHPCFLGMEAIDQLFPLVREWAQTCGLTFYDRKANTGLLRYAVIRVTTTGEAMVIVVTSKPTDEKEIERVRGALADLSSRAQPRDLHEDSSALLGMTNIIWSVNETTSDVSFGETLETISGAGSIEEVVNGFRYRITPNAFFQTNPYTAPLLQDTVREFAGDLSGKVLLDLYCGSGFFGISLARGASSKPVADQVPNHHKRTATNRPKVAPSRPQVVPSLSRDLQRGPNQDLSALLEMTRAAAPSTNAVGAGHVIGVELVPEAIRDAKVNAELNNVEIEFHEAKTEAFDWSVYNADVVIIDPPRVGLHDQALKDILRIAPKTLLYVSCNFKNFARELVFLKDVYKVEAMRAVDMFPHTPHVELVTKLIVKGGRT